MFATPLALALDLDAAAEEADAAWWDEEPLAVGATDPALDDDELLYQALVGPREVF